MYDELDKLIKMIAERDGITENEAAEKAYAICESEHERTN